MKKNTSIKKNFILSMFFQILNIITPLITAPYISRVLGANAVGIYSYTSSIQLYFSIFAALGTATYGCREIAICRDNHDQRSKLFWEIELLTVFTSIICLIMYIVLILFSSNYAIFLIALGIKLINTMLDISWFYIGIEELKYIVFKNAFFKIVGIALLFMFIKEPSDLLLYILIMCGTTFFGTITMWLYIPKFINKIEFQKLNIFGHLRHTIIFFIPTIATTIYTNIDKTLIGLITKDMKESAYYEQTTKILDLAKSVTFVSLNSLLTSRMSYLYSQRKIDEMKEKIGITDDKIEEMKRDGTFDYYLDTSRFIAKYIDDNQKDGVFSQEKAMEILNDEIDKILKEAKDRWGFIPDRSNIWYDDYINREIDRRRGED